MIASMDMPTNVQATKNATNGMGVRGMIAKPMQHIDMARNICGNDMRIREHRKQITKDVTQIKKYNQ